MVAVTNAHGYLKADVQSSRKPLIVTKPLLFCITRKKCLTMKQLWEKYNLLVTKENDGFYVTAVAILVRYVVVQLPLAKIARGTGK